MTFWQFLDRRWPSDRAWVVILLAILIGSLLKMADHNPDLWKVELFKTLLTAATITGALNMVLAFYFTANKGDEQKSENTGKAFDAIKAAATSGDGQAQAAQETAEAAQDKADEIAGKPPVDNPDGETA